MVHLRLIPTMMLLAACSEAFVAKDPLIPGDSGTLPTTDSTPTDTETHEPATIVFTSPGEEASSPVTLAVSTTGPVARVGYFLDSLPLVESTDGGTGFSATWRPEALGTLTLTARAYNSAGEEVGDDSTRTRVVDLAAENQLGVWLEDNEVAGYTHEELASRLQSLGVKRVYIQTGATGAGCDLYPDGCDKTVPAAYHDRGIQAFAFATPAPSGSANLATNVTYVADADYDGYVLQLTDQWGGQGTALASTLDAFRGVVDENIAIGRAPSNFPLYVAAGPTPVEIDLRLDVADAYVDGFMPLLLVEEMGADAIAAPEDALAAAVCEFASYGLTHPLHPVVGTVSGEVTPLGVNNFFDAGGAGSSVWRIPDSGDANDVWATWGKVDWTESTLPASATCD